MSAKTRRALSPKKRAGRSPASAGMSPWVWLGLLGVGGYALFKSTSASAATPGNAAPQGPQNPGNLLASLLPIQAGTQNIPELPGVMAATAPQVSTAAGYWATLAPAQGFDTGYINFPSGSQAAAALFPVRVDVYGSPYVQWAGLLFILTGPDSSGNYTATQVMT